MSNNPDLDEAIDILRNWKGIMPGSLVDRVNALLSRHPEKPKLLPCPFCGGDAEVVASVMMAASFVRCVQCDTRGGAVAKSPDDAIAAWNRRAKPASGPVSGGKPE